MLRIAYKAYTQKQNKQTRAKTKENKRIDHVNLFFLLTKPVVSVRNHAFQTSPSYVR